MAALNRAKKAHVEAKRLSRLDSANTLKGTTTLDDL